jgi:hypothetical protein
MKESYFSADPVSSTYKRIYQADFKDVYLDEKARTILIIWNANSEHISVDEYRMDVLHNIELIKNNRALYLISDYTQNKFNITTDIQQWYINDVSQKYDNTSLKKCALIIDADLKMLASLEEISTNLLAANGNPKIPHRYFPNLEEAFKWVFR